MKTKEEVIKAAWEEYWDILPEEVQKDLLKYNGKLFLRTFHEFIKKESDPDTFDLIIEEISKDLFKSYFRPHSLKGIEDNNGWIRVADALPKISGEYLVITHAKPSSEEILHVDLEQAYGLNFLESHCTHYRLKEQLKRPLYL